MNYILVQTIDFGVFLICFFETKYFGDNKLNELLVLLVYMKIQLVWNYIFFKTFKNNILLRIISILGLIFFMIFFKEISYLFVFLFFITMFLLIFSWKILRTKFKLKETLINLIYLFIYFNNCSILLWELV